MGRAHMRSQGTTGHLLQPVTPIRESEGAPLLPCTNYPEGLEMTRNQEQLSLHLVPIAQ